MAQLPPDGEWLVQLIGNDVIVFHRYTEEELVRFDATDMNRVGLAQGEINALDQLNEEQKAMAHFWSGYFYGCVVWGSSEATAAAADDIAGA